MSTTIAEVQQPIQTIRLTNGKTVTVKGGNNATAPASIPIIDVSRIYSPDLSDRKAVAEEIRDASRKIGFFTIINHGIDPKLSKNVLEQARKFFALPLDQKMSVSADLIPDEFCGYHPMEHYNINGTKRRDLHEAFNWNYDASLDPSAPDPTLPSINLWPQDLPTFRSALTSYQSALITFSRLLTRIFALALRLPETFFDKDILVPEAGARILHYPAQNAPRSEQNGIGAHTDVEYFTIVHADTEGLEILGRETNSWMRVEAVPGALVVNIGDCFMRVTNDFFVSTVHRVVNEGGKERYSVPFFWGFDRRSRMDVVPTCVEEGEESKYEVMTTGEYYAWRTREQRREWTM